MDETGMKWVNGCGAVASLRALGIQGFPTKFVIGRDGRVAWNSDQPGTLESAIDAALANSQSAAGR